MDSEQARLLALQLLDDTAQAGGADDQEVERLIDPGYWRELNPGLTIGGDDAPAAMDADALPADEAQAIARGVAAQGYLHTRPLLSPDALAGMASPAETAPEAGRAPKGCFLYDEFWQIAPTPSARAVGAATLGGAYAQTPKVWCHYVEPTKRSSGWRPHSDNEVQAVPREDRLTLWIPLTEATVDNGCMCLVPQDVVRAQDVDST